MVCPIVSGPEDPEPRPRSHARYRLLTVSTPAVRATSAPPSSRRKRDEKAHLGHKGANLSDARPQKNSARPSSSHTTKQAVGRSDITSNDSHEPNINLYPHPTINLSPNYLNPSPSPNPNPALTLNLPKASSSSSTQSAEITSHMPASEIISHLGIHGCQNLAGQLNEDTRDLFPVANGGFGDIYRAKLKCGTEVAIKTMRIFATSDEDGKKQLKHAACELYTWSKCHHKNVQGLLGLVEFKGQIGMVSTWEKNGDLSSYMKRNLEVDRCQVGAQIADGLSYLHANHIVHGDLKAANILVSENGIPLLADFGNAVLGEAMSLKFTDTSSKAAMSVRWTAPEVIAGNMRCSAPADIYALGMTILEAVTGDIPWPGLRDVTVMGVLYNKERPARPLGHIPIHSSHGNQLWELLNRCWVGEPTNRPVATEVQKSMSEIPPEGLKLNNIDGGK